MPTIFILAACNPFTAPYAWAAIGAWIAADCTQAGLQGVASFADYLPRRF